MLGMALLIALPYFLYTFRPEYRGLVPFRTNDDGFYMGRLDAAAQGHFREFQNGITGPPAQGVAPALLELLGGTLFSWTGLHGPQISVILTVLIAPLMIPLIAGTLRASGVGKGLSLASGLTYTITFLSPLQRPIYMSLALPLALGTIFSLLRTWQHPRSSRILLTVLLTGSLPAVYFWDFSYVWAVGGWFLLLHLLLLRTSTWKRERTHVLLLVGVLTFLFSMPFLLKLVLASRAYPFSAEVSLRNQVVPTHMIESPMRSILLSLLVLLTMFLLRSVRRKEDVLKTAIFPSALVFAAWTVMHQNLLHGILLTFSSHYYPFVCLAAVSVAAWALAHARGTWPSRGIVAIAAIFLLAGFWDYRGAWALPFAPREHLDLQHLAPALKILSDGKRQTILTDYRSAQMVTNWTDDDTVFTPYVRHLLVSNREFAERYCLTEVFNSAGPDIFWIAREATHTRAQSFLPEREREFGEVCAALLANPVAALREYGVDFLLWNERERPTWKVDEDLFTQIANGEDWRLYRIR